METDVSLANTLTVSRALSDSDEKPGSTIPQTFVMAVENGLPE
jgi:hypothetical protein